MRCFLIYTKKEEVNMNIQEYIKIVHNGNQLWFVDEVSHYTNQKRVLDVIEKKNI